MAFVGEMWRLPWHVLILHELEAVEENVCAAVQARQVSKHTARGHIERIVHRNASFWSMTFSNISELSQKDVAGV